MEITPEIKEKVYFQYWGKKVLWNGVKLDIVDKTWNLKHPSFYLILRPLSAITDEDAIEVINIHGIIHHHGMFVVTKHSPLSKIKEAILIINVLRADAYQYLQSKGYDLPNYHLGGKTLHESGLAIYE